MKSVIKIALVSAAMALLSSEALAQSVVTAETDAPAASFIKKRYNIKGTWDITEADGQTVINFHDNFKTKGGPDLKLYLSSNSIADLDSSGVEASSLKLSILKSNRGAQSYIIPSDINLSDYKSVVIHCEAFSVLWGGFDLSH